MNYLSYKEAFSALVQDNDGVLPDLYEIINITISCHPANAPILTTVADVVAYALIETSDELRVKVPYQKPKSMPPATTVFAGQVVLLDSLLDQAIACRN